MLVADSTEPVAHEEAQRSEGGGGDTMCMALFPDSSRSHTNSTLLTLAGGADCHAGAGGGPEREHSSPDSDPVLGVSVFSTVSSSDSAPGSSLTDAPGFAFSWKKCWQSQCSSMLTV